MTTMIPSFEQDLGEAARRCMLVALPEFLIAKQQGSLNHFLIRGLP